MKISITSSRGHHEAVLEPEISEIIFNKLTGIIEEPLPADIKIPDTFAELKMLWEPGKIKCTPVNKEGEIVKQFDPKIEELLFLAPIVGG